MCGLWCHVQMLDRLFCKILIIFDGFYFTLIFLYDFNGCQEKPRSLFRFWYKRKLNDEKSFSLIFQMFTFMQRLSTCFSFLGLCRINNREDSINNFEFCVGLSFSQTRYGNLLRLFKPEKCLVDLSSRGKLLKELDLKEVIFNQIEGKFDQIWKKIRWNSK